MLDDPDWLWLGGHVQLPIMTGWLNPNLPTGFVCNVAMSCITLSSLDRKAVGIRLAEMPT